MASFIEDARRKQIIRAAIVVLAREGYARASLSRIAREAKISKSVITYHFSGKDEMFKAVYAHVEDSAGGYMTPHLEEAGDPEGMIAAYIRSQIAYMMNHRDELLAIGVLSLNHGGPQGPDYLAASAREELDFLEEVCAKGQASGAFRDFDRRVMAAVIAKAIESALTEWAWRPETDLTVYAEELVALFSHAMAARRDD